MEPTSTGGIAAIITTIIGAIFGGGWLWRLFGKRHDNQTALTMDAQKHAQEMQKANIEAGFEDGTRAERILRDTVKKLETQLEKHEQRLNALENEKALNLATISQMGAEKTVLLNEINSLNNQIDKMIAVMDSHGVEPSVIALFRR